EQKFNCVNNVVADPGCPGIVKFEVTEIEQTETIEVKVKKEILDVEEEGKGTPVCDNAIPESPQPTFSIPCPLNPPLIPPPIEKKYQCVECFKAFSARKGLNRHRKIHVESCLFPCPVCHKPFKTPSYLRNHMAIHGEKRHKCDLCEKKFTDKSHLHRHVRQIHEKKPRVRQFYNCPDCGKVMRDKCRYTQHVKVHQEKIIACPHCPRKFKYQHNLDKHLAIHSADKPFQCTRCARTFKIKAVLVSHMRIHERGLKPLSCEICNETFPWKNALRKHMREHCEEREPTPCPHCFKIVRRKSLHNHILKRHKDLCLIDTNYIPAVDIKQEKD
uniref:C2H2-type domain-containing protein n=1 Tax=Phlebotomus papatasi TaxID=29031 RepID=A0A1B0DNQ2_PHLPP